MKKSELTTEQLKFFEQEEKDVQENILKALSRESVSKVLTCGYTLVASYIYENGWLGYHISIHNTDKTILHQGNLPCKDKTFLNGGETKPQIITDCLDWLNDEISNGTEELKKIFV